MAIFSWFGATATWSTGANWKVGGVIQASPPGPGDSCIFDGSGGGSSTAACTITATTTVGSVNFTGYTGTFTHNTNVTITADTGDVTFVSGMTYVKGNVSTSAWIFTPGAGVTQNLTTGTPGKVLGAITLNGNATGTLRLVDDLLANGSAAVIVTVTQGTFNLNSKNLTTGRFTASGASIRAVTLGTGTINVNATTAPFDVSGTNITGSFASGTITYSGVPVTTITLNFGTSTLMGTGFGTISTGTNSLGVLLAATTALNIATLNPTNPLGLRFQNGIITTISNAFSWIGTAAAPFGFTSSSPGVTATISVPANSSIQWAYIRDLVFTTNAITATNSLDGLNNSGITITPPGSGGGGGGIIGGGTVTREPKDNVVSLFPQIDRSSIDLKRAA